MQRRTLTIRIQHDRQGVTLTEVLMSMMIMSIGVSMVATLFPIAALRSAQATKLTNAAIVKYNVEAMIRARPELLFDPDGDFMTSTVDSPNYWLRLTEHFRTNAEKRYIIDPSGYFKNAAAYALSYGPVTTTAVGGVRDVNAVPSANRSYCDYFGNTAATATVGTPFVSLPRYDGGLRAAAVGSLTLSATTVSEFELLGSKLSNLGDGWNTVADEIAEGVILANGSFTKTPIATDQIIGVRLDSELDLTSVETSANYDDLLTISDPELTRITIFRADGRVSQTYPLTAISGQDCVWTEAAVGSLAAGDYNKDNITSIRALPQEFGNSVGRVLIQTKRTQDFNWMITVRRGSDGRAVGVDIVVMFSDGRSPDSERVYPATFVKGSFGMIIAKTSGLDLNGDPAEPFLKRGGFVLDVQNARWYRIAKHEDNPADPLNTYLITLESSALESSGAGGGGAVFLPGIVDVYPLGTVPLPETMTPQTF